MVRNGSDADASIEPGARLALALVADNQGRADDRAKDQIEQIYVGDRQGCEHKGLEERLSTERSHLRCIEGIRREPARLEHLERKYEISVKIVVTVQVGWFNGKLSQPQ